MGTTDPDLAALTRARPDALDPGHLSGSRRQHDDLVAILSTEREATPAPRPARRLRWLAVPVAGAAVVTAGGVALVGTLSGPDAVGAAAHPAAPHQAQDARVVLLTMAGAIEHETGSGAHWEQRTTHGDVSTVAGAQP